MAAAGLAVGTTSIPAGASAPIDSGAVGAKPAPTSFRSDNLPNPMAEKQAALRTTAMHQLIAGTAKVVTKAGSQVIEVSPGQYVEKKPQREEAVFTMLVEFGKKKDDRAGGTVGPIHNQIAKPDRDWNRDATDDNSTYWKKRLQRRALPRPDVR